MSFQKLLAKMDMAIKKINQMKVSEITICHHNDSDGLSSGAILKTAFSRMNKEVKNICLEKPYPYVLRHLLKGQDQVVVFADFAGRAAPTLSEINQGRNLVIILDHHVAEDVDDSMVFNLDPELYGVKGDRDISASTTCFNFALQMDRANEDLAYLAVVGGVGDGFFHEGKLGKQNLEAALLAEKQGLVEIVPCEPIDEYVLNFKGERELVKDFARYLDILGAVGYLQKGPEVGLEVCAQGKSESSDLLIKSLLTTQKAKFAAELASLREGALKQSDHIQWFTLGDRFFPMGVKMVGILCEVLSHEDFIDKDKYIAGFQYIPKDIPGIGSFDIKESKVSMRAPVPLKEKIKRGAVLPLNDLLPAATLQLGGFVDACHSLSAATTIKQEWEEKLIKEMENYIQKCS